MHAKWVTAAAALCILTALWYLYGISETQKREAAEPAPGIQHVNTASENVKIRYRQSSSKAPAVPKENAAVSQHYVVKTADPVQNDSRTAFALMSPGERNALSKEERLDKLNALLYSWDDFTPDEHKAIQRTLLKQWGTLAASERNMIRKKWFPRHEGRKEKRKSRPRKQHSKERTGVRG